MRKIIHEELSIHCMRKIIHEENYSWEKVLWEKVLLWEKVSWGKLFMRKIIMRKKVIIIRRKSIMRKIIHEEVSIHCNCAWLFPTGKGVTVCSLSPGFTYTGLFRHSLSRYAWLKKIAFLPIAFFFMRSTLQVCNYASPTSGEAYRDRRLTTNFELWVEIFCVSTCFHVRIPKPCLSAPREKKSSLASSISVLQ